ncbi:MAG: EscU/YscU/HrcU family type III secretion system export apparatus switch protein [Myxococcales bacterium]|nr:EscU/YscU/HrcU family type III secretion system export apparatus switch protein [Myxococcales bacterium]
MNEKPLPPTAEKLRRARREGDIPRSRRLAILACLLVGGGLVVHAAAAGSTSALRTLMRDAIREDVSWRTVVFSPSNVTLGALLILIMSASMLGSIAGNLFIGGPIFSMRATLPKLARLDPIAGSKKLVDPRRAVDVGLGLFEIGVLVFATSLFAKPFFESSRRLVGGAPDLVGAWLHHWLVVGSGTFVGCAASFTVVEIFLSKARYSRRLGMSFEEAKREHRESEGDPQLKQERARLSKAFATGSLGPLKRAAVVVANPTHVAVALARPDGRARPPFVYAKAEGKAARSLRERAERVGVPVVEDILLARQLYGNALGDDIPSELYEAVAALLIAVGASGGMIKPTSTG